jgi:glycosidase
LRQGEILQLKDMPKDVMAYLRKSDEEEIMVLLNFSKKKKKIILPKSTWEIFFSETRENLEGSELLLSSHEVLLLKRE